MTKLRVLTIAVALGLLLAYGNVGTAHAVALTNTNIAATVDPNSLAELADLTSPATAVLVSTFDFEDSNGNPQVGGDGTLTSQVFNGKAGSPAAGLYVYLYQATLFSGSSSEFLRAFAFNLPGPITTVLGMDSFYVGGNGGGTTCPVPASFACPGAPAATYHAPFSVDQEGAGVGFAYFLANRITRGEYGYVVGLFSSQPATIVGANVLDTTHTVVDPDVYAPAAVPEPSTVQLLGLGLLGLIYWGWWKKRKVALVALLIPVVMFALYIHEAMAVSMEYVTPVGSTQNGLPVNAKARFTTSVDRVDIILENLQADPKSVVQNLSDLKFTLSGPVTDLTPDFYPTGNSAQERTVAADGTFTNGAVLTTAAAIGWGLTNIGAGQYHLNDLGNAGPAHTLIGPSAGGGTYANANSSIAGNGPHNPFLGQSITWALDITGVTANTTITAAIFSFNTEAGFETTGVSAVPEPSTFLLLGLGLAGLATYRWRKQTA